MNSKELFTKGLNVFFHFCNIDRNNALFYNYFWALRIICLANRMVLGVGSIIQGSQYCGVVCCLSKMNTLGDVHSKLCFVTALHKLKSV